MAMWLLERPPYAVQAAALESSGDRFGWGYFMEQGLGKTATTLAEIRWRWSRKEVNGALVVCPNTLKSVWAMEAVRCGADVYSVVWPETVKGLQKKLGLSRWDKPWVAVMNYEATITPRGKAYIQELMNDYHMFFACDESICIANWKAQRTKSLLAAAPRAPIRRILTGKPVNNGPHDLWAQLRFIGAKETAGVNAYAWRNKYCLMERVWAAGPKAFKIVGTKPGASRELRKILHNNGFVARKKDWTDLPPKIYTTREVGMTAEQERHYRTMLQNSFVDLEAGMLTVDMAAKRWQKLQQITSGFLIDTDRELGSATQSVIDPAKIPKINGIKEALGEIEGKAIVFYFYKYSGLVLKEQLDSFKPAILAGGMKQEEIDEEKRRFTEESECRVILCQITASKYGHTLLGGDTPETHCSTVMFYENVYSSDSRDQAEDRNHRYGQQADHVVYIDFISSPSDIGVIDALQNKKNIAEAIIEGIRHNGSV